ncbi:SulP family inorganic anion transporter [Marinomonas sp. A79]|uniref:SulP family inorganic anion transporter n=1 Tax=Marinomonas vulgaris TaxID=2823372 RepID=A0ABS5HFD8_9GAMM|nr:SulP family inorganic anion transporter [Marinomonas vulgaris]MBR7889659.1 SulP family inorganic anion transporter [Marinomonas vulgaris]
MDFPTTLPPEFGLYTAIVSATLAALSIVAATVVSKATTMTSVDYISLMLTLTLMVGVIQLVLGFLKVGVLVNFISHSVVQGFTAGAAIIIAASQLKNLLGLNVQSDGSLSSYFLGVVVNIEQTNMFSLSIGLATVLFAVLLRRYVKRVPYLLGAMVLGAALCFVLGAEQQGVIVLDALSGALPVFRLPSVDADVLSVLLSGAIAVALLGLIEAASIARSIAMRSKQQIDGNQEFVGQGMSNIIGSVFSCYPSSGSFTRSGGNYDAGAKTPLASVFAACFVVLFLLFLPSVTHYIPVPVMAGSIMVITWNLFNIKGFLTTLRAEKSEVLTFLGTFLCTLFLQLEYAIYAGVFISIGCYLYRTSRPKITRVAPLVQEGAKRQIRNIVRYDLAECPEIKLIRVDGSVFFGSSDHLQKALQQLLAQQHRKIILIAKGINFIDSSGQHMLLDEIKKIEAAGGHVFFSSLKGHVCDDLEGSDFKNFLDQGRLFTSSTAAINTMIAKVEPDKCAACVNRVFLDCPNKDK